MPFWSFIVLVAALAFVPPRRTGADAGVLRSCGNLSASDESKLVTGEVIVKTLPASHRELAIAGAIRMELPAGFFIRRMRDIAAFKQSDLVEQVRPFSDPPRLDDLRSLEIEAGDLDALRDCRIGDCDVKLSAGAIERLRVDAAMRNNPGERERLSKSLLLEGVTAYREHGDQALPPYVDKHQPVNPAADLHELVDNLACVGGIDPDELAYLREFPRRSAPGADSFLYWSKERFGMKAIVSVTHVIVFPPRDGRTLVASKGIYSNHYVDASLSLTWLIDAGADAHPAVIMLYVNRTRVDALGGPFGGLARRVAAGRQRERMAKELRALRVRLEEDWRAAPDGARAAAR